MRKRLKVSRKFVGIGTCLGAVSWSVAVQPQYGKKHKHLMCVEAELSISDEAQSHYVDCTKDMAPLFKMQRELNEFILQCGAAIDDVETHNEEAKAVKDDDYA